MQSNHRLLTSAFRRIPPLSSLPNHTPSTQMPLRLFSSSTSHRVWDGRQTSEHTTNEKDTHNVQQDAVKEGKKERAKGSTGGERGTSEKSGGTNKKAKEEFPEAPDTIGMQDERGQK